jgi:hypothetical protein
MSAKYLKSKWYSWGELNHRPPDPQSAALRSGVPKGFRRARIEGSRSTLNCEVRGTESPHGIHSAPIFANSALCLPRTPLRTCPGQSERRQAMILPERPKRLPLQVSGERVASRHRPHPTREPLLTRRLPWAISTSKTPVKKQEMRNDYNVVPQEGFEPPTPSLRMMCSTD